MVIDEPFAHKFFIIRIFQLVRHGQTLLLQVLLQANEMRAHGTGFAILQRILIFIEDLCVCLSDVFTEHGDCLISCLMVECQKVDAKFIVDVFGDCFALIVLLGCFNTMFLALNSSRYGGSPVFDRGHTFLSQ